MLSGGPCCQELSCLRERDSFLLVHMTKDISSLKNKSGILVLHLLRPIVPELVVHGLWCNILYHSFSFSDSWSFLPNRDAVRHRQKHSHHEQRSFSTSSFSYTTPEIPCVSIRYRAFAARCSAACSRSRTPGMEAKRSTTA